MEQQNTQTEADKSIEVSEQIFPVDTDVTLFDGAKVSVFKIKMKHNAFLLGLVQKLIAEIGVNADGDVTINLEDRTQLLQLIAKFPDDINELTALLSSLSRAEVDELELDDGIKVLLKIIEVNRSFFTERVMPLVMSAMKHVGGTAATEPVRVSRTRKK